jgi:septal ring factor EnvC (AmiA/AmiB activator)
MRFRLLRRRLTISAPNMAIRTQMPWPLKWALAALVLGFCSAIGLWAFEFGKDIAGIDRTAKEDLTLLRQEVTQLRAERDKAQSLANTSYSAIATEKAAQDALTHQIKALEAENRQLRDDLGFFEKLIPAGSGDGVTLRGFTAELLTPTQIRWQFLVIHATRNAPQFNGRYELSFSGLQNNRPWSMPGSAQTLSFQQLGRLRGVVDLPPHVVVKSVTLKIYEGAQQRAVQTIRLS